MFGPKRDSSRKSGLLVGGRCGWDPGGLFERLIEGARQVFALAQEEARAMGHNYIGAEHILLGLLCEEKGLAARALQTFGITVDRVRGQVVKIVGPGEEITAGQIPFTAFSKRVVDLSMDEALNLGHKHIGTEHILLGLAGVKEDVAGQILRGFGADAEQIRNQVIGMLPGPGSDPSIRSRSDPKRDSSGGWPLGEADLPAGFWRPA